MTILAIEVEYLMGRVYSSSYNDRQEVEWPPHPSRFFAALVAACHECDMGINEREALKWLETLPPPSIYADPATYEYQGRDVHGFFVPVNDTSDPFNKTKNKPYQHINTVAALGRNRQVRWFPSFAPYDNRVWFIWDNIDKPKRYRNYLQTITEQVAYLGHSTSLVRMRVADNPPAPTLIPEKQGDIKLRVTGKGRLQHLEQIYQLRKTNITVKPHLGKICSYRVANDPKPQIISSYFSNNYIFRLTGLTNISLCMTNTLISTIRKAIISLYPDPVPEIISGHNKKGKPSQYPHLAIIPLPDIGHVYADGHIMGFSLWLPENTPDEILETFETILVDFQSLTLGKLGVCTTEHLHADPLSRSPIGLRPTTYSGVSDTWASICPVLFGKYPKKSHVGPGKNGGKIIHELCSMIGLPAPKEIRLGPISVFRGVPKASEFQYPERYKANMKSHVVVTFHEPVKGPVFLGAGRYKGFGLCRPFNKGNNR